MSFPKVLAFMIFLLCCGVAYFSWSKIQSEKPTENSPVSEKDEEIQSVAKPVETAEVTLETAKIVPIEDKDLSDDINRVEYLFKPYPPLLPIVETISYSSKVDWLKGRPAYLGDYASHFQTSKHFISRSLKGKANYFSQNVSNGNKFNIFRRDKNIQFHLVLDLSRLKMKFYYFDKDSNERVLLKTYRVSAGKLDQAKSSGSLTPLGQYSFGQEIAIYKEGVMGSYNNKPCEMVTVFGNRWIPFEKEIGYCTAAAKGLGLHGMPWIRNNAGEMVECREYIGKYESSGCVRLLTEDIEEIFSIIITKPSFIHIVSDFKEAKLPGNEINPEI